MVLAVLINGGAFQAHLAQVLEPELREGVGAAIEAAGKAALCAARRPRLQSIENAFSKLKALLREAAARPSRLCRDAIGRGLDRFMPSECATYFVAQDVRRPDRKPLE